MCMKACVFTSKELSSDTIKDLLNEFSVLDIHECLLMGGERLYKQDKCYVITENTKKHSIDFCLNGQKRYERCIRWFHENPDIDEDSASYRGNILWRDDTVNCAKYWMNIMRTLMLTDHLERIGIFALRPEKMLDYNVLLYPENMEYEVNSFVNMQINSLLKLSEYRTLYFTSCSK